MAYYILRNGRAELSTDIDEWCQWYTECFEERVIQRTTIYVNGQSVTVSTVFLAIDHQYGDEGKPILWETMIFGGPRDQEMFRYTSLGAAKVRHFELVEELRSGVPSDEAYGDGV